MPPTVAASAPWRPPPRAWPPWASSSSPSPSSRARAGQGDFSGILLLSQIFLLAPLWFRRAGGGRPAACVSTARARSDDGLRRLAELHESKSVVRLSRTAVSSLLALVLLHIPIRPHTLGGVRAWLIVSGILYLLCAAAIPPAFATVHTRAFRVVRDHLAKP